MMKWVHEFLERRAAARELAEIKEMLDGHRQDSADYIERKVAGAEVRHFLAVVW